MRLFTLSALSCAAVALSACGTFTSGDDQPVAAPAAGQTLKAPPAMVSPSSQEQKELSAMMGESAPASDTGPTAAGFDDAGMTMEDNAPVPVDAAPATGDIANSMSDSIPAPAPAAPAMADRPHTPVAGAPQECPGVEVLPDTKSLTYFDDPEGKPNGPLIARASLVDIKGGCDYTADGVVVDIDMIMQGKITEKGRYEGRKDLEAFMTFPYFVAVMDPDGKMVDKKIMATAMRFKPSVDDLDHAEKITQSIPMADISRGGGYTITVGFQLNRAQLDYNRGTVTTPKKTPASTPEKITPPAAALKAEAKTVAQPSETVSKPVPAPAATVSAGAKMTPIVE